MVVNDLDATRLRLAVRPLEANSPAIVDPDAVLTCSIANQRLEAVARQHHEGSFVWRGFQEFQSLVGLACERLKLADSVTGSEPSCALVLIFVNAGQMTSLAVRHTQIVPGVTLYVKRNERSEDAMDPGAVRFG